MAISPNNIGLTFTWIGSTAEVFLSVNSVELIFPFKQYTVRLPKIEQNELKQLQFEAMTYSPSDSINPTVEDIKKLQIHIKYTIGAYDYPQESYCSNIDFKPDVIGGRIYDLCVLSKRDQNCELAFSARLV